MTLVEGKHLSKTFPTQGGFLRERIGGIQALNNVSFAIQAGETFALVGGSGCGKSTLAKILAGLINPDAGQLLWKDKPLESLDRLTRARGIQMIFQDPYASLNPKLSVRLQLEEVLRLVPEKNRQSPAQLLQIVGLAEDALGHYPFQFSGGQRQRIAIARALAMNPELLIADEPLSALDVTTQAQILDLFNRLKKELSLTFLFITHDLAVASEFADRVMVLQDGSVVEEGVVSVVLKTSEHPYTRALLEAVPKFHANAQRSHRPTS